VLPALLFRQEHHVLGGVAGLPEDPGQLLDVGVGVAEVAQLVGGVLLHADQQGVALAPRGGAGRILGGGLFRLLCRARGRCAARGRVPDDTDAGLGRAGRGGRGRDGRLCRGRLLGRGLGQWSGGRAWVELRLVVPEEATRAAEAGQDEEGQQ